tara:strand:+ start:2151 stop:5009 length:2859 start_codon:yes stop_codon:yes gene_type:complete
VNIFKSYNKLKNHFMKKFLSLILGILFASTLSFSQYTYSLIQNPGNPGGLNNDNEYPFGGGLDPSWVVILGPNQSNPSWSSTETIPFNFNFNGFPVTQYKVSSTGVLTFSTSAVLVPGAGNAALPDPAIPDNSIMVWGIEGTGTNDNICTKTFGSPGSQQHWIFFTSYTSGSWTYWSIVLEESSNKFYIVDQRHGASAAPLVTAGIQINSSSALMVAGSPQLGNLAGADPSPADNRYYEFNFSSASCINPYSFTTSNRTINSADLSWVGSPSAINYNIEFGISGFSQGSGTLLSDTIPSYSFSGLTPSQFYDIYVQTVCDTSDSSLWSGPITFSTLCVENAPYLENYDNSSFPVCFIQGDDDIFDWTLDANGTASNSTGPSDDISGGGNYIYIEASSPRVPGDSAVVFSPYIDKGSLNNAKLTFYSHMYGASIGTLRIEASDDGGNSYSTIFSKSGDQGDQWNYETVCLGIFSDTVVFKVTASVGDDGSGTQWFGDIAIDNFEISEGVALDIAGLSVTVDPILALNNAPFIISGDLNNIGCNTINSMDINYSIDGGATVTMPVNNINFLTGDIYSFNHITTWNPPSSGTYNVEIWASNLNGSNDMDLTNDRVNTDIIVASALAQRRPIMESFTSSTCGPCVAGNSNVASVLSNYANDQYSILKYQMSWPGVGDPYYSDEGGDRRVYYSVNTVPNLVLDGNSWQGNSSSLTTQLVDDAIATPSFINLSSNYSIGGQTIDFTVDIDPLADFSNLTLYAAIFEYITFNNFGTNGEIEFNYVMKKMVPGSSGFNITSLQEGNQVTENFSYTFQGNYILPPDANSPVNHTIQHTVEDFNNLGVIVWIQDDNSKEILQSTTASLVLDVNEDLTSLNKFMVFPNPSNEIATIAFMGLQDNDIDVKLVNLLGEVVLHESFTSSSILDNFNIDVSSFSNGVYNVVITSNDKISTQQLQILR